MFDRLRRAHDEPRQHVRLPGERGLVRRLDIFLMTFGCISQGTLLTTLVTFVLTLYSHQVGLAKRFHLAMLSG